jgi:hypothetical protein
VVRAGQHRSSGKGRFVALEDVTRGYIQAGRLTATFVPGTFASQDKVPLLDHFHLPVNVTHPWKGFHLFGMP